MGRKDKPVRYPIAPLHEKVEREKAPIPYILISHESSQGIQAYYNIVVDFFASRDLPGYFFKDVVKNALGPNDIPLSPTIPNYLTDEIKKSIENALALIIIFEQNTEVSPDLMFECGIASGVGIPIYIISSSNKEEPYYLSGFSHYDQEHLTELTNELLKLRRRKLREQNASVTVESLPLSAQLRLYRQEKHVSLTDLANTLNCSKSYLSKIENGYILPTTEIVEGYTHHLEISDNRLLNLLEKMEEKSEKTPPGKALIPSLTSQDPAIRSSGLAMLITRCSESLRHYVMAHAPSEHVDDIYGDVWEIVINKVSNGTYVDHGQDPISFVLGIAHSVTLRYNTHHQHEVALDETSAPLVESALMNIENYVDVASLRQKLSDPEDQAVLQALLADQSVNDMALAWNCHYKTAWRRYHKFLDHCRVLLGDTEIPAQLMTQKDN